MSIVQLLFLVYFCNVTALEVEETRSIANVRIHVERVIGLVRQTCTILQGTLPIDYVTTRIGEDCPTIDRIARMPQDSKWTL